MQEVVLKLCSTKANGIVQQAKRAFVADASAGASKNRLKRGVMFNGGLAAVNVVNTATQAYGASPAAASVFGAAAALFGTSFGMYLKEFMQAVKTKKETAAALKDIINKREFADILKRYIRINGEKGLSIEELITKHIKGKNGALKIISKD